MKSHFRMNLLLAVLYSLFVPYIFGAVDEERMFRHVQRAVTESSRKFPFMGNVWQLFGGYWRHCGATLLNEEWALTAAHCVNGDGDDILIYLGSEYLYNKTDPDQIELYVSEVHIHPSYSHGYYMAHDIALLRIKQPVQLSRLIQPIDLPSIEQDEESYAGTSATYLGWGLHDEASSDVEKHIKGMQVTVMSNEECQDTAYDVSSTEMCATGSGKTCDRTTGGPLVVQDKGRSVLIGVFSWSDGKCPLEQPRVFTRITSYLDWISQKIGKGIERGSDQSIDTNTIEGVSDDMLNHE